MAASTSASRTRAQCLEVRGAAARAGRQVRGSTPTASGPGAREDDLAARSRVAPALMRARHRSPTGSCRAPRIILITHHRVQPPGIRASRRRADVREFATCQCPVASTARGASTWPRSVCPQPPRPHTDARPWSPSAAPRSNCPRSRARRERAGARSRSAARYLAGAGATVGVPRIRRLAVNGQGRPCRLARSPAIGEAPDRRRPAGPDRRRSTPAWRSASMSARASVVRFSSSARP
jgi:hypothetical protein